MTRLDGFCSLQPFLNVWWIKSTSITMWSCTFYSKLDSSYLLNEFHLGFYCSISDTKWRCMCLEGTNHGGSSNFQQMNGKCMRQMQIIFSLLIQNLKYNCFVMYSLYGLTWNKRKQEAILRSSSHSNRGMHNISTISNGVIFPRKSVKQMEKERTKNWISLNVFFFCGAQPTTGYCAMFNVVVLFKLSCAECRLFSTLLMWTSPSFFSCSITHITHTYRNTKQQ